MNPPTSCMVGFQPGGHQRTAGEVMVVADDEDVAVTDSGDGDVTDVDGRFIDVALIGL